MNQHNIQKRQELNQRKADAGFVAEILPDLSEMEIKMTYYQLTIHSETEKLLMERTINLSPTSSAFFDMQCMNKSCDGSFDLTKTIKKMVKSRKKTEKGRISCSEKGKGILPNHANVDFEIVAKYSRKKKVK